MIIFAYEELPEGLKVMLRVEGGTTVIVIDRRLSRVERLRAKEAGKQMLRQRRRHMLLPAGLAEDWAQRLREWAPVCRAPAVAVAGGALAMTVAVGSGVVDDRRQRQPWYVGQGHGPVTSKAVGADPVTPASFAPTPTRELRTPERAATGGPLRGGRPADEPADGREAARKSPKSGTPTVRETGGGTDLPLPEVRDTVEEVILSVTRTPAVKPPKVKPKVTPTVDTPTVDVPEPAPARTPEVRLPEVQVDPTRLPKVNSSLLDKPLAVGECDGLVDVNVKPLPKVCVGG